MAEVHRGTRLLTGRRAELLPEEDRSEEGHIGDGNSEIGGDPGNCREREHEREADTRPVEAAERSGGADAAPGKSRGGEREGEGDAHRSEGIDGPRIEVALVDHARDEYRRAQPGCDEPDDCCGPCREPVDDDWQQGDDDETRRKAEVDEEPRRSALEPAAAHVVQSAGGGPPVRREHLEADQRKEGPDDQGLGEAGPAMSAHAGRA